MIDIDNGTVGNQSEGDNVAADVESIAGGGGDDILVGGTGAGSVVGNGGNDVLNGGADTVSDTISGGSGLDTVSYAGRTNSVTVTLDGTANDGEGGENDNVLANVENATGGSGADTLTGNDSVNSPQRWRWRRQPERWRQQRRPHRWSRWRHLRRRYRHGRPR